MVLSSGDTGSVASSPGFFLSMGKFSIYYWDGCSSFWRKLDLRLSLPPETLFYGEQIMELWGEGKAQRRSPALHLIDPLFLGGKDVRRLPFDERLMMAHKLAKAVKKPTLTELDTFRVKKVYELKALESVFEDMDMKECKGGNNKVRLCHELDETRFLIPSGLLIINSLKHPWISKMSHSQKKPYWFNLKAGTSDFSCPPDAVADFATCFLKRYFWRWNSDSILMLEDQDLDKEQMDTKSRVKSKGSAGTGPGAGDRPVDRKTLTQYIEAALKR
jgi:cap1 methyltransferase